LINLFFNVKKHLRERLHGLPAVSGF